MASVGEEFERATAYELLDEDIESFKLLVGADTAVSMSEYITTATPDAIRNFARAVGDDNPLWFTEHYGDGTRWGSQIAPPVMAEIINAPLRGDPLPPEVKERTRGLFRGIHVYVSGGSWEFYRPIYPGDRLYSFGGYESVEVKESEYADRSVIRVRRYVKMNQRAEVVAVSRTVAILTERKKARDKGKYRDVQPASYSDEELAEIDRIYESEKPRGSETRWWEDVEVGEALPAMAKGPLTETEIIVFHAGGYGFAPYWPSASRLAYQNRRRIPAFYVKDERGIPDVAQRVHWDSKWAQAIGNPMAYDYGVMRETWLHHMLTDWIGDDGWPVTLDVSIRKFNYIGDTQLLSGEVVGKRQVGPRCYVDLELRATNQRAEVTAPASATVLLPSREHGAVVLPDPPDELRTKALEMMRRHDELSAPSE
jgi:acyl dehydratase